MARNSFPSTSSVHSSRGAFSRCIHSSNLSLGSEIGRGQFKSVLRGRYQGQDVAVLSLPAGSRGDPEIAMLLKLADRRKGFVPEVYGMCDLHCRLCVVVELAKFGTWKALIQEDKTAGILTSAHRVTAASQIASAMAFLQSEQIVHADLACRNVLCFDVGKDDSTSVTVKLSDFGLSVQLDSAPKCVDGEFPSLWILSDNASSNRKKQARPIRWCSPETVLENKLSHYSDAWSLGATLWEAFGAGENPWFMQARRADVDVQLRTLGQQENACRSHLRSGAACSCDAAAIIRENFPCQKVCPAEVHDVILLCLNTHEFQRPLSSKAASSLHNLLTSKRRGHPVTAFDLHKDDLLHCEDGWTFVESTVFP